jgi:hypothetical protein
MGDPTYKIRTVGTRGTKCWDMPAFSFERVGLYFTGEKGAGINFCDLHFFNSPGDRYYRDSYYTGPTSTIQQALGNFVRSKKQVDAYYKTETVAKELDIARGGKALLTYSKASNLFEVWLIGPLLFGDKPFGSLSVELRGWTGPSYRVEHDPKSGIKGRIAYARFPSGYVGRSRPAKLWGSAITPPDEKYTDINYYNAKLIEHLKAMKKYSWEAELPKGVKGVYWKVEAASGRKTDCYVLEQHG